MMHAVLRLLAGLLAHDSSNFSDTWPPNMTTELGGQVENAGGASSSQAPRCQIPGARSQVPDPRCQIPGNRSQVRTEGSGGHYDHYGP